MDRANDKIIVCIFHENGYGKLVDRIRATVQVRCTRSIENTGILGVSFGIRNGAWNNVLSAGKFEPRPFAG